MTVRSNRECGALQRFLMSQAKPVGEPAHDIAALAERATEDVALSVQSINKGTPGDREVRLFHADPKCARGAYRRAEPLRADTIGADVCEGPIAQRKVPGNIAKMRPSFGVCRLQAHRR